MASVLVSVRQKAAVVFHTLVETHAAEIGKAIGRRLRPLLREGEVLPDFALVLALLGRLVAAAAAWLVRSDKVHESGLDEGVEPRVQRDLAALVLRRKVVEIRTLGSAFYGRRGSAVLGLVGRTAEAVQPELLWRQARTLLARLRDPQLEAPGNSLKLVFDPVALGRELEPEVSALRQALDAVEREQRQAGTTLAAKEDAMGDLDSVLKACVLVMKGAFALAGRPDVARKLGELSRRKKPLPTGKEVDVKTR